jgi:hypothetical protein
MSLLNKIKRSYVESVAAGSESGLLQRNTTQAHPVQLLLWLEPPKHPSGNEIFTYGSQQYEAN